MGKISVKECAMWKRYRVMGIVILLMACIMGCTGVMKADMRLEQKNYRGAIELYKEYLTQNPGDFSVRSRLGLAYLKANMPDNAAAEFESALRMKPGDPFPTLYLGVTYLKLKELSKAMAIWGNYKDKQRPLVEKEIGRQLVLLRAEREKNTPFGKADQLSATDGSRLSTPKQLAMQMDESIRKAEAAWGEAESAAMAVADGAGDGDGGDGGGGG